MVKKILKSYMKKSILSGSLRALISSLRDVRFNTKSIVYHLYNYYFKKIGTVNKLNIGCGKDYKEGFLNIDMNEVADIYFDARNRLPLNDESIEFIYSSHFIEHLTNVEIIMHLRECYRLLSKGGIYRICLPDFKTSIASYINNDMKRLEKIKSELPCKFLLPDKLITYADYLDRSLHEYGTHKVFIDYEKTKSLLMFVGFREDEIMLVPRDEKMEPEKRMDYSIVIEATK